MSLSRCRSGPGGNRSGGHTPTDFAIKRNKSSGMLSCNQRPQSGGLRAPIRVRSLPGLTGTPSHTPSNKAYAAGANGLLQRAASAGRSRKPEPLPKQYYNSRPLSASNVSAHTRSMASTLPSTWAIAASKTLGDLSNIGSLPAWPEEQLSTKKRGTETVTIASTQEVDEAVEDARASSPYSTRLDAWRTAFEDVDTLAASSTTAGFNGELCRVAGRIAKVRRHFKDTRRGIAEITSMPAKDTFSADINEFKVELRRAMADLVETCNGLSELATETEDVAFEVDALQQADEQMSSVLDKCNKKLDLFTATLGSGL